MLSMKVLYIDKYCFPLKYAVESFVYILANQIKDKVDISILVSNDRIRTNIENIRGISITRMARFLKIRSTPICFSLPLWMRKIKTDIIHFTSPNLFAIISYLIARPRVKVICSYPSNTYRKRFFSLFYKPFLVKFFKKVDKIIISDEDFLRNSKILKRFRSKCEVIPYGVDIKKFNKLGDIEQKICEFNERYGYDLILYRGSLTSYKGVDYLIKAMRDVNAKLLIIGDGPLRKKWESLAEKNDINEKVIFLGVVPPYESRAYLQSSLMLVAPLLSPSEDFEVNQLEAFASGIPVISTDLGASVPRINRHRETGLVVPTKNSKALAEAINTLLKNEKLRLEFGENAKRKALEDYNIEYIGNKIINLYENIKAKDIQ